MRFPPREEDWLRYHQQFSATILQLLVLLSFSLTEYNFDASRFMHFSIFELCCYGKFIIYSNIIFATVLFKIWFRSEMTSSNFDKFVSDSRVLDVISNLILNQDYVIESKPSIPSFIYLYKKNEVCWIIIVLGHQTVILSRMFTHRQT